MISDDTFWRTTLLTGCPEFDKRTSLGVKRTFPKVMYSANFISETISKDICAQLAREVVSLVPQIVDYSCTICEYHIPQRALWILGYMATGTMCRDWNPGLTVVSRPFPLLVAYPTRL